MISTAAGRSAAAPQRVTSAIANAASESGIDFSFLMHQARLESGFDADAQARTSSASGLFQFVDQTWLATVDRHGAANGLGWAADAIERTGDGRYRIADPATRDAVLNLRNQPEAAASMAAAFAADNRDYLAPRIGREPEPVDLYLAHFLGPAGAARLLEAHADDPETPAATLLPAAAAANRTIFYASDGTARSVGAVRQRFAGQFNDAVAMPPTLLPTAGVPDTLATISSRSETSLPPPSPAFARIAYTMLSKIGV